MEDFMNYPDMMPDWWELVTVQDFVLTLCNVDAVAIVQHQTGFEKYGAKYALYLQDMGEPDIDARAYLEHHTGGFEKGKCQVLLWDMEEAHKIATVKRWGLLQTAIEHGWQGSGKELQPMGKEEAFEEDFTLLFGKNYDRHYNEAVEVLTEAIKSPVRAVIHTGGTVAHNETEKPADEKRAALPKELATDEAQALFAQCEYCQEDAGLYTWNGTKALFGYFVEAVSGFLDVRPSNDRLPWKLFAEAFKMSQQDINTARQAVNSYKNNRASKPEGWQDIYRLTKK